MQECYCARLCHRAKSQSVGKTTSSSNHDGNYYRGQQMLNGQYIKMSVNGASMICSFVSAVIPQ